MTGPIVVKFGGSLLGSPERDGLLAAAARRRAILVPGGGPFADAVRTAQPAYGFGDAAAHAMAILAMDQTAHLLADLAPDLALCASSVEFSRASEAGRGAIWRPSPIALGAHLPMSWDLTSDSLALWLATTLGASRLVLLKAAPLDPGAPPAGWADAGLVDRCFPLLARTFSGDVVGLGPATATAFDDALTQPLRRAA